ncbi:MAG TPA: hypothetical protein VH297_05965 [Gaiellaceae bacterium]|jgi:hypothetical protein
MGRVLRALKRLGFTGALLLVVAATSPAAALGGYWDFQGILHDLPQIPYDAGETNPNTGGLWGIRISRTNCEAKMIWRSRSDGSLLVVNIPGGCSTLDTIQCYNSSFFDASVARNTDTGPGDVYVNVRVDHTLNEQYCP